MYEQLCEASLKEDLQTLKTLVSRGVDVNIGNYDGIRALHLAADAGLLSTVLHLLEADAHVNCTDRWGRTPLLCAVQNGHDVVVRALIVHGGKLLLPYKDKAELLVKAAREGKNALLSQLLLCDIDINMPIYDHRTPLHAACLFGNVGAVKLLVENSARPNPLDSWMRTPLQIAIEQNYKVVQHVLQAAGGVVANPCVAGPSDVVLQRTEQYSVLVEEIRTLLIGVRSLLGEDVDEVRAEYEHVHLCSTGGLLVDKGELVDVAAMLKLHSELAESGEMPESGEDGEAASDEDVLRSGGIAIHSEASHSPSMIPMEHFKTLRSTLSPSDMDALYQIEYEVKDADMQRIVEPAVAEYLADLCRTTVIRKAVPTLDFNRLGNVRPERQESKIILSRKRLSVNQQNEEFARELSQFAKRSASNLHEIDEDDSDGDPHVHAQKAPHRPAADSEELVAEFVAMNPSFQQPQLPGQVNTQAMDSMPQSSSPSPKGTSTNGTPIDGTDLPPDDPLSTSPQRMSLGRRNSLTAPKTFTHVLEHQLSPRKVGKESAETEVDSVWKRTQQLVRLAIAQRAGPMAHSLHRFCTFMFMLMSFVSGIYYVFKVPFDFAMHIDSNYNILDFKLNIVFDVFGLFLLLDKFRVSQVLMHKTRLPELRDAMFKVLKQILIQGISTMPFELIPWMFGVDAFVVLGVRALRMIHFHKTFNMMNELLEGKHIRKSIYDVISTLAILLGMAHFGACANFLLVRTWPEERSMLYECSFDVCQDLWRCKLEGGPWTFAMCREAYLVSAYWILTTFVAIGVGDLTPLNTREVVLCIVVLLGNLTFYAFVLVRIMAMMAMGDADVITKRNKYFGTLVRRHHSPPFVHATRNR